MTGTELELLHQQLSRMTLNEFEDWHTAITDYSDAYDRGYSDGSGDGYNGGWEDGYSEGKEWAEEV